MTGPARRPRGDDGSSMVLALAFLAVLALFITASLGKAYAMLRTNRVVAARGQLQYAADGGVELALRQLRVDRTTTRSLCLTPLAGAQTVGTATVNGHPVTYSCEALSGFAGNATDGGYGFAVVTTATGADSLTTQSGSADALRINGSVYAAGEIDLHKDVEVTGGDVAQLSGPYCSGADPAPPARLTVVGDAYDFRCTSLTAAQLYAVPTLPALPTGTLVSMPAAGLATTGSCRVFAPGVYTTRPSLLSATGGNANRANYFRSGVYYLHDVGEWTIGANDAVVAGRAGPKDAFTGSLAGCGEATDPAAGGTGATFVLGGSSRITVAGRLQVNYRAPLVPGSESTAGMSVVTVTAGAPAGYATWSSGSPAIATGPAVAAMHFNGRIMAPNAPVELFASNPTEAAARAGIVAYRLGLQASAAGESLAVQAERLDPTTGVRTLRVTATAEGVNGDGGPTVNTAVVEIDLAAPYAVDVRSWRTS